MSSLITCLPPDAYMREEGSVWPDPLPFGVSLSQCLSTPHLMQKGTPNRKGMAFHTGNRVRFWRQEEESAGRGEWSLQGGALEPAPPGVGLRSVPRARTWAQLAVLREALQAVLQQHGDDPVQVRHLAGEGATTSWQLSFQNSGSLETLCSGCKCAAASLSPCPGVCSHPSPTPAVSVTLPAQRPARHSVSLALGLPLPLPVSNRPMTLYLGYTLEQLKGGLSNFSKARPHLPRV